MVKRSSFLRRCRKAVICLILCCMMQSALSPAPAKAFDLVWDPARSVLLGVSGILESSGWTSMIAALTLQSTVLIAYYAYLQAEFYTLREHIKKVAGAELGGRSVYLRALAKSTDAISDAMTKSELARHEQNIMIDQMGATNDLVCKAVFGHQLPLTTYDFELEVARVIDEGVSARGRCKTCSGNGPDYVAWDRAARTGAKPGEAPSSDLTNFTSKLDGFKVTGSEESLADADLTPVSKTQVMRFPKITNGAFDPQTVEEARWLAKRDRVLRMAGARPHALDGANMATAIGKVQRAAYNHCLVNENVLIHQCSEWQAFNTRPNCEQDKERCTKQKVTCLNATEGLTDISFLGNCEEGLSPMEVRLVEQLMCKSKNYAVMQAGAGKPTADQMKTIQKCNLSWDAFEELVAQKHDNCVRATAAISEMNGCWAAVESLGTGRFAARAEELDQHYFADTPFFDIVKDPKVTPINTYHEAKDIPKGHIISADKVKWPKAIGQ